MHKFSQIHISFCVQCAKSGNMKAAISEAKNIISQFPPNLVLISQLIDYASNYDEIYKLSELMSFSLEIYGQKFNTSPIARHLSYLNYKLLRRKKQIEDADFSTYKLNPAKPGLIPSPLSKYSNFKIAVLSCIWGRDNLTRIFLEHLDQLRSELIPGICLIPIIIGSGESPIKDTCNNLNMHYFHYPNNPLSDKWEYGLQALKQLTCDAVIILGSDDFINSDLIKAYANYLMQGVKILGLRDCLFLDLNHKTDSLIKWNGYGGKTSWAGQPERLGESIGMARCISTDTLEEINYSLWGKIQINSGLDKVAFNTLKKFGHYPISRTHMMRLIEQKGKVKGQIYLDVFSDNIFAVDVKYNNENITSIECYKGNSLTHKLMPNHWEIISDKLGVQTGNKLRLLHLRNLA